MKTAFTYRRIWLFAGVLLGASTCVDGGAHAADVPKDTGKPALKCLSVAGALLEKQSGGSWRPVKAADVVPSGALVIALPQAELVSVSGAVQVRLLADIGNRGPFPVLEAALIAHDAGDVDLDLTPARGLLVLENLKKEGAAKVRLRLRDETWVLQLQTPGTKVGMEIFGRLAPGLRKTFDAKNDLPTTDVLMLVLSGQAFVDTGKEGMALRAPPGLARLHWDSVLREPSFQRLETLPKSLLHFMEDQQSQEFKDLSAGMARLGQGDLGAGLDKLIHSQNKHDRLAGLTLAGAVDDLPRVIGVLTESKDAATRDHAVLVLRHWLGREPGQIPKLATGLMDKKKLTEVQTRNVIHLLLGFDAEERRDPNTFVVLLSYLDHHNQAIRTLAQWHLVRLAPAGKDIAFDAAGPEQQRQAAVQRWRALIPEGQLPPPPKAQTPPKS